MNNFKRSIVALIVVCLLHYNHAWLLNDFNMDFSRKINTSTTITNTCNCSTICYGGSSCGYSCNYSCGNVGGRRRRRRSLPKNAVVLILPCKFGAWDMNRDGIVTIEEFAFTGHAKMEDKSTEILFQQIDMDNNGSLSKNELMAAPLNFEKC